MASHPRKRDRDAMWQVLHRGSVWWFWFQGKDIREPNTCGAWTKVYWGHKQVESLKLAISTNLHKSWNYPIGKLRLFPKTSCPWHPYCSLKLMLDVTTCISHYFRVKTLLRNRKKTYLFLCLLEYLVVIGVVCLFKSDSDQYSHQSKGRNIASYFN